MLSAFFAFAVGLFFYGLWAKRPPRFKNFPPQPRIDFEPNKENKGKQCQPVYYGMGSGDGIKDDYCFDLQNQLSRASGDGDIVKVKELLRSGANAAGHTGISALRFAASAGNTEIARILLDNGADINHWALSGTPLMAAVGSGNAEMVELILSRGADVELKTDGYNALGYALEKNNPEIISLLRSAGASKPIPDNQE